MKHNYSKKTLRKRLAYGQRKRREFLAAGLRTDGKPRVGKKPCGCQVGCCLQCASKTNKLHISAETVAAMFADYQTGMSLEAVGRKYPLRNGDQRAHGEIRELFRRRGLPVRAWKVIPRQPNGSPVRYVPRTEEQLEQMVQAATRVSIPAELKFEWRRWSMKKRQAFVRQLRQRFPSTRPTGPFSKDVQPFIYGDPNIHAIAARMNQGRTSRTKVIALKPASEGVIYQGQIYFWTAKFSNGDATGYLTGKPPKRHLLHHIIWIKHNRRPVPPKTTVVFLDGNKNNFDPVNLGLRSMADCARMNQVFIRLKSDPNNKDLQAKARNVVDALIHGKLERSRRQTAALLKQSQSPDNSTGLLAKLKNR